MHPFFISAISTRYQGRIGLCPCPGRIYPPAIGGALSRNLEADLLAVKAFPAAVLVTLMEIGELEWAGLSLVTLKNICKALYIIHFHLPIADEEIPDAAWEKTWQELGPQLHETLRTGQNVVFHCRGGRGRAGVAATRLLIDTGEPPKDAIARVRGARPGAVETRMQEEYLLQLQL